MRQWNSEQVLGVFSRRLRGRLVLFATALLASAAVVFTTFRGELERFRDPVPEVVGRPATSLAAQAAWLRELARRPDVPRALLERHAERIAQLTDVLTRATHLRERLIQARGRRDVDLAAFARLEEDLERLEALGHEVEPDRLAWRETARRVERRLAEHERQVEALRTAAQTRERELAECLAAHDERVALRLVEARDWAREVEEEIARRLDPSQSKLEQRTAFLRAFRHWWQGGTAPASELETFWSLGIETPRLRGLIELLRLAQDDLVAESSSKRRLARLEKVVARVPAVFADAIGADRELLRRLAAVTALEGAPSGDDLGSATERALGWFARATDLELLRRGAVAAQARTEAQGFREAVRAVRHDDPWDTLHAMGRIAEERFAETGIPTFAHWIEVLDRAHAEGLLEDAFAVDLRLALLVRAFAQPATGRDALRYLGEVEASGAFRTLDDRRPFTEIGSLARMFGEVLEARKGRWDEEELRLWNAIVRDLLRVLIDADRHLGDAALAASDAVNETAAQRTAAFRSHPATKLGFALRGEWNDRFRREAPESDRRRLGDAVFRMLMIAEREVAQRVAIAPVATLTRAADPAGTAVGHASELATGAPSWAPLPRATLEVTRERVDRFLELGVPRARLIEWAGRGVLGEAWREGFRVPLEPCPWQVDGFVDVPPLALELAPGPPLEPIGFDEAAFHIDPRERHRTSFGLAGAGALLLLVLALLLFRRVVPTSFTLGPGEDGVARLAIAGPTAFSHVRLRDAEGGESLLTWTRDGDEEHLHLQRALPATTLTYRRRRGRRGATTWVLVPREPRVHALEDQEFGPTGQRLRLRGEGFTSRVRASVAGVDLTPHEEERTGFTTWAARIPDGVLPEGRHTVQLHWEGGTVAAGEAILGRSRLVESDLPSHVFTAEGARAVTARFALANDRGEDLQFWRQGPEGPREALAWSTVENESGTSGTRTLEVELDLPLGRQRIEIDTCSATLTRAVWVLERGTRVLSALWRDAAARLVLEQRILDPARGEELSSVRRTLPGGFTACAARFADGELWIGHGGGVLVVPTAAVESRIQPFAADLVWRDDDRFSCARLGDRRYVALGNEAPGSGRLFVWEVANPTVGRTVEWADEELLEIGRSGARIAYVARSELHDLAAPEEPLVAAGHVAGTDRARRLLRFLPYGESWYVIDLQYRLRDLADPERRELANLAARGAFLDPLRILAIDRRAGEVELLVRDATNPQRIGLLPRDPEGRRFPRDAGTWFAFDGEVLAATVESDGD